jgi:hypothetical protein
MAVGRFALMERVRCALLGGSSDFYTGCFLAGGWAHALNNAVKRRISAGAPRPLRELLATGLPLDPSWMTSALALRSTEVLTVLLEAGGRVPSHACIGDRPAALAALTGNGLRFKPNTDFARRAVLRRELLLLLCEAGADCDAQDFHAPEGERSLLHALVRMNDVEAVRRLIRAGADVNLIDERGRTPLETAVATDEASTQQTVDLLREVGARLSISLPP